MFSRIAEFMAIIGGQTKTVSMDYGRLFGKKREPAAGNERSLRTQKIINADLQTVPFCPDIQRPGRNQNFQAAEGCGIVCQIFAARFEDHTGIDLALFCQLQEISLQFDSVPGDGTGIL